MGHGPLRTIKGRADRFVYFAILILESNQRAIGGNFGKKQDALPSIVSLKRVLWAEAINFSTNHCWQLVVALRGGNSYVPPLAGQNSAPPAWARRWAGPLTRRRWVFLRGFLFFIFLVFCFYCFLLVFCFLFFFHSFSFLQF
jgi:hypothetical protein